MREKIIKSFRERREVCELAGFGQAVASKIVTTVCKRGTRGGEGQKKQALGIYYVVHGIEEGYRHQTEEKAKVVAAVWGTEIMKFLAALDIFHQDDCEEEDGQRKGFLEKWML